MYASFFYTSFSTSAPAMYASAFAALCNGFGPLYYFFWGPGSYLFLLFGIEGCSGRTCWFLRQVHVYDVLGGRSEKNTQTTSTLDSLRQGPWKFTVTTSRLMPYPFSTVPIFMAIGSQAHIRVSNKRNMI